MTVQPVGDQLRAWRVKRRMSQMDLALDANISTRHLSFIETGRSRPSADMVERLADRMDVPLRSRNQLLLAAGHAPHHAEHALDGDRLDRARQMIEHLLRGHEPYPALAIDRHWNLVAANGAVALLLEGVAPELLVAPVNVIRLSLHPSGLGARLLNYAGWRAHILHRLDQQFATSGDAAIKALRDDVAAYPQPPNEGLAEEIGDDIVIPLVIDSPVGPLSFLSTTTIFGTPLEVTLSEIAIESFFPADQETAERLGELAAPRG